MAKLKPIGKVAKRPRNYLVVFANGLLYLALGIGFLAWEGFPIPNAWAIYLLLPLPWAALALSVGRPDLFSIDWNHKDGEHETLALLMFGPALALAYYAANEFVLTQWGPAMQLCLLYALIGSAVMTGLAVLCCRRLRESSAAMIILAIVMIFYAGATAQIVNAWLDRAEPNVYRLPIISARSEFHSRTDGRWYFTLGAWGPRTSNQEYQVERSPYQGAKAGQIGCIFDPPGLLGMAWYEVEACRGRGRTPGASDSLRSSG